jgi:hypothetical protein
MVSSVHEGMNLSSTKCSVLAWQIVPRWSIDSWCESQQPSDWTYLHQTSKDFLERLSLSSSHPFCEARVRSTYQLPNVPGQGPLLSQDHLESAWDVVVTIIAMGLPSLAAMAELWLRLLSSLVAPLGIAQLIYVCLQRNNKASMQQKVAPIGTTSDPSAAWLSATCLATVASSVVLLTDTLYNLEHGPKYGGTLACLSVLLSVQVCRQNNLRITLYGVMALVLLAFVLVYDMKTGTLTFGEIEDAVHIDEGLYYDGTHTA